MLFKQDSHGHHSSSRETCQAAGSLCSVCANIQLSVTYKIVLQLEAVLNAAKDLAMLTCSTGTLQTCGGSMQEGGDLGRSVAQADATPDCPQSWVSHLTNSLECDWCLQLYTMPNCVNRFELE